MNKQPGKKVVRKQWILPGMAIAAIVSLAAAQPVFISYQNLGNVLRQSSFLIIFALAQMVPIVARGLDLSQGGVVSLVSVLFGDLAATGGFFTFGELAGAAA